MRVIAARRAGPLSFQVILSELTPGGQPCALHLLGMVSGVGARPPADRRNQSEIFRMFSAVTGSGILTKWLYACAVQPLPHAQPAARGQRGGRDRRRRAARIGDNRAI